MTARKPRDEGDLERLGLLVDQVLRRAASPAGLGPQSGSAGDECDRPPSANDTRRIALVWGEVVGADVREHAQPQYFRRGRLTVATSSSVWAQTLQLMGDEIRDSVNHALGEELVLAITFRQAGWTSTGR